MYQLDNFFQNHRQFVNSRSYYQLSGHTLSESELECFSCSFYSLFHLHSSACDPRDQEDINPDKRIPCGIAAATMFNDSYSLALLTSNDDDPSVENISITKTGITWASDRVCILTSYTVTSTFSFRPDISVSKESTLI